MPWRYSLRLACAALGMVCLALALVGVFIPVLPTTPFVLLAAFLFSRSSPRMHEWLLRQPVLGPIIVDWHQHHAISTKAKLLASAMILASASTSILLTQLPVWLDIVIAAVSGAALVFVVSRPTPEQAIRRNDNLPRPTPTPAQ